MERLKIYNVFWVTGFCTTILHLLRRTLVRLLYYSATHPNPSREGIFTHSPRYTKMLILFLQFVTNIVLHLKYTFRKDRAVRLNSPFRGLGGLLLCVFVASWQQTIAQRRDISLNDNWHTIATNNDKVLPSNTYQ